MTISTGLLDAARPLIRVKQWREPRPFGSTVAYEEMCDIELAESFVVVPVAWDDMLPVEHECILSVMEGYDTVKLRFSMPQVGRKGAGIVVTYDIEVVDD